MLRFFKEGKKYGIMADAPTVETLCQDFTEAILEYIRSKDFMTEVKEGNGELYKRYLELETDIANYIWKMVHIAYKIKGYKIDEVETSTVYSIGAWQVFFEAHMEYEMPFSTHKLPLNRNESDQILEEVTSKINLNFERKGGDA